MHSQTSGPEESNRRRRSQREQFPAAKSLQFEAEEEEEIPGGESVGGPTTRRQWTQWCQRPHEAQDDIEVDKQLAKQTGKKGQKAQRTGPKRLAKTAGRRKSNFTQKKNKKTTRTRVPAAAMDALNAFHNQTLMTSSQEGYNKMESFNDKSMIQSMHNYAVTGRNEEKLSSVLSPTTNEDQPALQKLLDTYKEQLQQFLEYMGSAQYRDQLKREIDHCRDINKSLKGRVAHLEKQISNLQKDSLAQLKARLAELGIVAQTPAEFLAKAKEIVMRHKELQVQANMLQGTISHIEQEQSKVLLLHYQRLQEEASKLNGKQGPDFSGLASGLIWKELAMSLAHRNKLVDRMSQLENQVNTLEGTESPIKPPDPPQAAVESETTITRAPLSATSIPTAATSTSLATVSSTKSSPRRRGEAPVNRRKSPKDKKALQACQSQNVKANPSPGTVTLDSKLNSIIANALVSEKSGQPIFNSAQEGMSETSKGQLANSWLSKSGNTSCKAARDDKSPHLSMVASSTFTNASQACNEFISKKQCTGSMAIESNQLPTEHSSIGKLSVPVKIPLSEVGKKPASVPVSIPLEKLHGEQSLKMLEQNSASKMLPPVTVHTSSSHSLDPVVHDVYSPISRPSSSSSTASAESVRHLENGARVASVSPRPSSGTSFHIDNLFGVERPSVSTAAPSQPHGMSHFTPKDLAYAQYAALHAQAARGLPSALASDSQGKTHLDELYLAQHREMCAKMLSSGVPYAASQANNMYSNGLVKMPPLSPVEEKKKVPKRKRSGSKSSSLGMTPTKQSRSPGPSYGADFPDAHRRFTLPAGGKMKHGQSQAMNDIMSNVSKPLAISALPDTVVTPKYSSLERGPGRQVNRQAASGVRGQEEVQQLKDSPTSHNWQAQISSGFDALLGFASSELHRTKEMRRKSMEAEGNKMPTMLNGPVTAIANPALVAAKVLGAEGLGGLPGKDSSGSRSDSRDSGLGKDSESDGGKDGTLPGIDLSVSRSGKSGSPYSCSTSSRPGSRLEAGADRMTDDTQSQSPHARPRSRSPCERSSNTDAKSTPDKYCNYDKHFKKKFFGKELRKTMSDSRVEKADSHEVRHAKFRPKGKDWEKNQSRANNRSTSPGCSAVGSAVGAGSRGKSPTTLSSVITPTSSPSLPANRTPSMAAVTSQGQSQAGMSLSNSGSKLNSAFHMTSGERTFEEKVRPPSAEGGPAPSPSRLTLSGPGLSRPPSLGPPMSMSLPPHPSIRNSAELAHAGLSQLARATMGASPFSQNIMDHHSSMNSHLANLLPPNSGLLAGTHRFGVPRMDFETSRLLYAEMSAPRPFGVSFGGPPSFQSPIGDIAGPRASLFPELAMPRSLPNGIPGFSADAFNHSKEKAWKALNSRK